MVWVMKGQRSIPLSRLRALQKQWKLLSLTEMSSCTPLGVSMARLVICYHVTLMWVSCDYHVIIVGCGVTRTDLSDLKFLYEGHPDFSVLPSYAVIPAMVGNQSYYWNYVLSPYRLALWVKSSQGTLPASRSSTWHRWCMVWSAVQVYP